MRMWMVNPRIMCRKHLLGEHVETHMFLSCVVLNKKLNGYIKDNMFEIEKLAVRHDILANEMTNRNYKHVSPLNPFDMTYNYKNYENVKIDADKSLKDLLSRCPECRKRYEERS